MTVDEAVYDILERIGHTSDDTDLYRWVLRQIDNERAEAVKDYLKKSGNDIPPSLIVAYECQLVVKETADCDDCPKNVLNLTVSPIDLPNDIGVYSVSMPGGKEVERLGTLGMANLLSKSRFSQKGWYRIQNKIYLKGSYPDNFKLNVYLIPEGTDSLPGDAEYPAPSDLMDNILEEVERKARRKIGTLPDLTSDGKHDLNR